MASTDFKDYYAILGVKKGADAGEIKRAFRKLALKYHPDRNPGNQQAEARFKEASEAYEVLSDPDKRQKYDQFGQYWRQVGQSSNGSAYGNRTNVDFGGFDFGQYSSFEEFINELLGGMGATTGARPRSNYRTSPSGTGFRTTPGGFGTTPGAGAGTGDREATIRLTFSEAFRGVQKRLNLGNETIDVRIPPGRNREVRVRVRGQRPA
ncbi:MAG: DnaJ domain-containing protein, partial [Spirulinaceae cyanobacterium RM2_2_10]|nr:DnaJ domain-containing protein [Spirulinaceae cyanobacterium RM2_2_10]